MVRQTGSRERIIAAALERFAEQGFHACGVKELTEAAGVLKGSFYNYFASKEQLAVEVLGTYLSETDLGMLRDYSIAPLERIRTHFEHVAAIYRRRGYHRGCLMNKFANELSPATPLIGRDLAAVLAEWSELLAATIREGQDGGSISSPGDPDQLARCLLQGWNGAVTFMRAAASRAPLDDFFEITFRRVVSTDDKAAAG